MARKRTHSSTNRRSRGNGRKKKSPLLYVILAVCALAIVGVGVWYILRPSEYKFQRAHLDKYIEMTKTTNLLNDGASVYLDMSDGMNFAYSTPQSKSLLQAVINKLAADRAINFFELSDSKITPLEKSHTELYNYMLNLDSYDKQRAPIEQSLKRIVKNRQPALLMTDFEEYKGNVVERAAYAKQYFIDWLKEGYNITFYKWDFNENGKMKHMFLAVFDDNANRLNSLVDNAVKMVDPNIATYVLGSRDFAYPTSTQYPSLKQGGNYHNGKGEDAVTAVMENGGPDAYVCYSKPYATATGEQGKFAPLDISVGEFADYYPLGVNWKSAIENSKKMKEAGILKEDLFTHLFRNLFIDFGAQDGYAIDNVEVRVFDMQKTVEVIGNSINSNSKIDPKTIEAINNPEINMVLTSGMLTDNLPIGWKEIFLDFDEKFDGSFIGGLPATDFIRANIMISKATPEIRKADNFFGWEGNPSLAESVKNTLTESTCNPVGRILFTYYIKTINE